MNAYRIKELPDIITCPYCIGYGTRLVLDLKYSDKPNSSNMKEVKCLDCEGTGKKPIPKSEI